MTGLKTINILASKFGLELKVIRYPGYFDISGT